MDKERETARGVPGVIGCLTAGFEMLTQNLQVVALPVVLDLVLWLGPRVSVSPLVDGVRRVMAEQAATDPQIAGQVEQAARLFEQFGERFNLLSVLGGFPMFEVPSLLARHAPTAGSPLGTPQMVSVSSILALFPWWAGLGLLGLSLGFVYLNEIAGQVRDGAGLNSRGASDRAEMDVENNRDGLRKGMVRFLRFLAFAAGLMVLGLLVVPVWVLMVTLVATVAEPLGILAWVGGVGMLSYAALHLLFVVPGLLLGDRRLLRAIGESILLIHLDLSSVFGFVLLAVVIYEGLSFAWSLPNSDSWALLIGILGNAFVATGLTGAAFIFYRDRVVRGHDLVGDGQ